MKRPRKVKIDWIEYVHYQSKYDCPFCHTIFVGFVGNKSVTRFICQCGNELIVEQEQNPCQKS